MAKSSHQSLLGMAARCASVLDAAHHRGVRCTATRLLVGGRKSGQKMGLSASRATATVSDRWRAARAQGGRRPPTTTPETAIRSVQHAHATVQRRRSAADTATAEKAFRRLSVTLNSDEYARLAAAARANDRSLAWVVRETIKTGLENSRLQLELPFNAAVKSAESRAEPRGRV